MRCCSFSNFVAYSTHPTNGKLPMILTEFVHLFHHRRKTPPWLNHENPTSFTPHTPRHTERDPEPAESLAAKEVWDLSESTELT
mmetsp:Transcript_5727/g.11925  ORF Transcript_5727/g.11925 Transcript_5727/m.11925 type:complete len:84 (-) Transcript_5727:126-377(-)